MSQLEKQFNQKKANLEQAAEKFETLKAEKIKTEKTILAFQNELQEAINQAEKGLISNGYIEEEEYIDCRNKTTGLKARIEYHQAKFEDLENKIYEQAETVKSRYIEASNARELIFAEKVDEKLITFIAETKEKLSDLFTNYYYSGKFENTGSSFQGDFISSKQHIMDHLLREISKSISQDCPLEGKFKLTNPTFNFEFKTPTQKLKERFNTTQKGFENLVSHL